MCKFGFIEAAKRSRNGWRRCALLAPCTASWIVAVTRRNTSANSVLQYYREGHKDDHICLSMITEENHEAIDNGDCTDGRGTHDSDLGANPGRTRFTSPGGQRKSRTCSSKFETGQKPARHERARRRHGRHSDD